MKKIILFSVSLLITLSICFNFMSSVNACTTFYAKSDKIYIGKNWDFTDDAKDHITFEMFDLDNKASVFGTLYRGYTSNFITSKGLYGTCNDVFYGIKSIPSNINYATWEDVQSLLDTCASRFSSVKEIIKYAEKTKFYCNGYSEHLFFADSTGNACIIETDNEETYIYKDEKSFLPMANIPLFALDSLSDINKVPGDRYYTIYKYIDENIDKFNFDNAVEALNKVVQPAYTLYSFVHTPLEDSVYLFINQDFDRVWKMSFSEKTLSTYKGFYKDKSYNLDLGSVTWNELNDYARSDFKNMKADNIYPVGSKVIMNFETNGGNNIKKQIVVSGNKAVKPLDPVKNGYVFTGWYNDKELTKEYDFNTVLRGNITIYAKWTPTWYNPFIVIFHRILEWTKNLKFWI